MTEPVVGAKTYFAFEKETGTGSAWGTRPTTPVVVHAPIGAYGVELDRNVFEHTPFIGIGQQVHAQSDRASLAGTITMPLYGAFDSGPGVSLAQYFIELATDEQEHLATRPSLRGWNMQCDGDGNLIAGHEDYGLRVNKMTLKGSESGIELSLDVIGKDQIEQANDPGAIPNDRNSLTEFAFSDSTLTIGGSAVAVAEWSWEMDWSLKPWFGNSTRIQRLHGQMACHTLTWKPLKESDTYDAYMRLVTQTELTAVLNIKGLHSGTSTNNYANGAFTFARASLKSAKDTISYGDFGFQPIVMKCLKPDTSVNTVVPVWSTVA